MNAGSLSKRPLHFRTKKRAVREERMKWGNAWSNCQESVMSPALTESSRICTCFTLKKNQAIWLLKAKRLQALSYFAYTNQNDLSKQCWRVRLITFAGLNKIFLFDRTICWKMLLQKLCRFTFLCVVYRAWWEMISEDSSSSPITFIEANP